MTDIVESCNGGKETNSLLASSKRVSIVPHSAPIQTPQVDEQSILKNIEAVVHYEPEDSTIFEEDRARALSTIEDLLRESHLIQQQIKDVILTGPTCPYEKTLEEYLGPNFICPSIDDIEMPRRFQYIEAVKILDETSKKYEDMFIEHVRAMSAESMDMNVVGITSENLGHAFAELTETPEGPKYIVNKQKTAQHLAFAEIVRNIPTQYIIENPIIVAQKLVSYYTAINST
jgi:hypothetical protein